MNSFLKRSQVPSNAPAAAPKEVEPDPLFKAVDSAGYSHALIHSERLFGLENFGVGLPP